MADEQSVAVDQVVPGAFAYATDRRDQLNQRRLELSVVYAEMRRFEEPLSVYFFEDLNELLRGEVAKIRARDNLGAVAGMEVVRDWYGEQVTSPEAMEWLAYERMKEVVEDAKAFIAKRADGVVAERLWRRGWITDKAYRGYSSV